MHNRDKQKVTCNICVADPDCYELVKNSAASTSVASVSSTIFSFGVTDNGSTSPDVDR